MIALRPSQSCPSSTPYHCASGASTSPKTSGPPAIKASHARRTSSISGLSPISMSLAHPRANGCGPVPVPFGARCGLFAVSRPTNSREHERTRSRDAQRVRGYSRVFAAVRGSLRQSGRTVREPANTGAFGRLRSHLRSSYRFHTGLRAYRSPAYAMLNARIAFFRRLPQPRYQCCDRSAPGLRAADHLAPRV